MTALSRTTPGGKRTVRRAGFYLIICIMVAANARSIRAVASEQNSAQTGDAPATAARQDWERLRGKTSVIKDISATAWVAVPGVPNAGMSNLTYRVSISRELGLARMELVLSNGRSRTYFVDEHDRSVRAYVGEQSYILDPQGASKWLSMYDVLASITDVNIKQSDQFYSVGSEAVRNQVCSIFTFTRAGLISKKLWVGIEDGIVYKVNQNGMTCDFLDVKVNTGLDKKFLGGDIVSTNATVVSQRELYGLWHKYDKNTK